METEKSKPPFCISFNMCTRYVRAERPSLLSKRLSRGNSEVIFTRQKLCRISPSRQSLVDACICSATLFVTVFLSFYVSLHLYYISFFKKVKWIF